MTQKERETEYTAINATFRAEKIALMDEFDKKHAALDKAKAETIERYETLRIANTAQINATIEQMHELRRAGLASFSKEMDELRGVLEGYYAGARADKYEFDRRMREFKAQGGKLHADYVKKCSEIKERASAKKRALV